MKWLEQFKDMVDKNPEISDGELFRAFPELQNDPNRMTWALVYWHDRVIVPEFKKVSRWQRFINFIWHN